MIVTFQKKICDKGFTPAVNLHDATLLYLDLEMALHMLERTPISFHNPLNYVHIW